MTDKAKIKKFFKAWQGEFQIFEAPTLKKVLQKKKRLVSISAGRGAWEKDPTWATVPFEYFEGQIGGELGKPKVRGFKRLRGGKKFKDRVKAQMYAKKLLRGL